MSNATHNPVYVYAQNCTSFGIYLGDYPENNGDLVLYGESEKDAVELALFFVNAPVRNASDHYRHRLASHVLHHFGIPLQEPDMSNATAEKLDAIDSIIYNAYRQLIKLSVIDPLSQSAKDSLYRAEGLLLEARLYTADARYYIVEELD